MSILRIHITAKKKKTSQNRFVHCVKRISKKMAAIINQIIRRRIATAPIRPASNPGTSASAGEHSGGYKVWKRLSFFVAMPAIGLCMLNAYLKHQEEHNHPRPEFVKYDYLCRREKRFPWGDGNHSLFHNPHTNPLPTGYEDSH